MKLPPGYHVSNWSVVATVKADKELIDIFINHYIKIGASEIFIYLDDPSDKFIQKSYLSNTKVKIYTCDDEFWSVDYKFNCFKYVGRPDGVEDRQCHNLVHALSKTTSKWIGCVDIDELIYSERNILNILNTIPDNVYCLRLKPFEATYLNQAPTTYKEVFSTKYFKHLTKRSDVFFWNEVFPKDFIHKSGFFGHISGKCFLRTDEPLKWPGLHNPKPLDMSLITNFRIDDIKLLHFEALTVDYFATKTTNRINKAFNVKSLDQPSVVRLQNLKKIFDSSGLNGLQEAYSKMHVLNSDVIQKAISIYLIDEINISNTNCDLISILVSTHNSLLVFNTDTNECQLKSIDEAKKLTINLNIVEIECDVEQKICYLFTRINNKVTYLYLNKYGKITSYPFKKAMIFHCDIHDNINSQISIVHSNGQYFTATPSGDFKLGPTQAKAWEIFHIKNLQNK